ncbi:3-deoxy-D-manno-octulosonic acid transferase [Hyphobacterium sp.]|uniref:3-deoxy-D-manno-octulosonic acid transferase n=1 Tax=Hyphobacterium sp. TaxID=2004662 RepID=UPI003BABDF65
MSLPLPLQVYRWTTMLLAPLSGWMLDQRRQSGKEDPVRLRERFGYPKLPRPDGTLLWLHGASVGESRIILDLVRRLQDRPGLSFLVTTGTVTSANMLAKELPEKAHHQYIPIDRPACVRRFFDHWRPDAAVFVESELWPNLLAEVRRRDIPAALINARMNEKSLDNWSNKRTSAGFLLGAFSWIGAADARTSEGLSQILGTSIPRVGNLKLELVSAPTDQSKLAEYENVIGQRPVWLAASTHEGEDEVVLRAHREVLNAHADSLLILAPRHPERGGQIAELINNHGMTAARLSSAEMPATRTQVWQADTLGEMPYWFNLSEKAFIGGSLINGIGGHNPIEATEAGCAVISGPFFASFADVYAAYADQDAVTIVRDPAELAQAILLNTPDAVGKAQTALKGLRGTAMADTLSAIDGLLPGTAT